MLAPTFFVKPDCAPAAEVSIFRPSEFDRSQLNNFSAIAFSRPSMGVEVLEETEFQPMFADLESALRVNAERLPFLQGKPFSL